MSQPRPHYGVYRVDDIERREMLAESCSEVVALGLSFELELKLGCDMEVVELTIN